MSRFAFADLEKLDCGARFYTADLHVHSYGGSADVQDSTMTVEAIVDAAVGANVGILSITDHNNDKSVLSSLTYGNKYADRLLVLPGVEISTANGHLLVYGNPAEYEAVSKLLAVINMQGPKGARDTHTTRSMADVMGEAEQLGLICIAAHIDRSKTGFEMLANGYPNWKQDILLSPGLFGIELDDPAHLMWFSKSDESGDLGGQRKAIAETRRRRLANTGRPVIAAVQNSDSHTLHHFTGGLASETLTRYKMTELTFNGFRTALTDPESRVRPKAVIPSAVPRVRGIHITGGFLDGEVYRFSDNLNTFIGGRGTGKSTAVRSLAYGLGLANDFENHDNCPDAVIVFCEDATGVLYRVERMRGGSAVTRSKIGTTIQEVPLDSFRVEYYDQGDLSEVAKDPLKNPTLLQSFLDRHLTLSDLLEQEQMLLEQLENNSAELIPLENGAKQLAKTRLALADIEKKLQVAKEGRLKELAEVQAKISAEKALIKGIREFAAEYERGLSFASVKKDYNNLRASVGALTEDSKCVEAFQKAQGIVASANAWIDSQQAKFNSGLASFGHQLREAMTPIPARHSKWDEHIAQKTAQLQAQGLSGGIAQLQKLIGQRAGYVEAVAKLVAQQTMLVETRQRREKYLKQLFQTRETVTERRKGQLHRINQCFKGTIEDYAIYLYYEPAGICNEFVTCVLNEMHGTHFPEATAEALCQKTTPSTLAALVSAGDTAALAAIGGLGPSWARQLVQRSSQLKFLHALQVTNKPPCPRIRVLTKTTPQVEIPVNQLSDGQKHTILLTIAMLAESNDPLIIDQPEDDLDNAFIFRSVVKTLRYIKERRQVLVVTHNANIAVLGDSELLFPMKREGEKGRAADRGSVDKAATKRAVIDILEGGGDAFLRRRAIYGV